MEETLEKILNDYTKNPGNILTILQELQKAFGYVPEKALIWFSNKLNIPSSRLFGIITFYSQFHLKPQGANVITVCRGTACHINGSEKLLNRLLIELGLTPAEDTTEDFKFTVEKMNCIGACGMAPVVMVNDEVHGKMSFDQLLEELKKLK